MQLTYVILCIIDTAFAANIKTTQMKQITRKCDEGRRDKLDLIATGNSQI